MADAVSHVCTHYAPSYSNFDVVITMVPTIFTRSADESQQSAAQVAAQQQMAAIRQKASESKPFKPSV